MLFPGLWSNYKGLTVAGQVTYPDHAVDIPAEAVDHTFIKNLSGIMRRLAS